MKKKVLVVVLGLMLFLVACGSKEDDSKIEIPFGSEGYKNSNYKQIVKELEKSGYENVKTKGIDDLITGWLTKDGEVEKVTVDGKESFEEKDRFDPDVKIVVSYHTFEKDEEKSSESSQAETDEASKESKQSDEKVEESTVGSSTSDTEVTESKSVEKETESSTEKKNDEKTETSSEEKENKNITVENSPEFSKVVSEPDYTSSVIEEFVKDNEGKNVEFDGCIINIANAENYSTRYDILISAGDYEDEETANPGPMFKFKNVNREDMHFTGEGLSVGQNINIVAEIDSFNSDQGIFFLLPTKVSER